MALPENNISISLKDVINPLLAGACAGSAVDISLFPIDTIKTRLQSPHGFWRSGGFSRIYSGLGSAISGSAPSAALFFLVYESSKYLIQERYQLGDKHAYLCYIFSASFGEMASCLVRVPVEVVKQRAQAFQSNSLTVLRQTLQRSGVSGLYRGYFSTLLREIPFSSIQFPLWEYSKSSLVRWQQSELEPYQSLLCGSLAGGVSAFVTTPLDVVKTRIMLHNFNGSVNTQQTSCPASVNYFKTFQTVYNRQGIRGLFAGAIPRVIWISTGGAIFLGGYDIILTYLDQKFI